jgi:Flp pilus assembly protein TadD
VKPAGILLVLALCIPCLCPAGDTDRATTSEGWEAQFHQGLEFLRAKKYPEARQCFLKATQLNPRSAEGFFYLGICTLHTGDRPAAEAALRHALKLNPTAVNALYNLGVLLLEDKKPGDAAQYFERARKSGPLSPELAVYLIRAYLEAGHNDRAVRVAETADPQFADSAEFDVMTGNLFLAHGVAGPACSALRSADRLQPHQLEIALPLASACLENKDVASARAALASVQDKAKDSAQYHTLAARVHFLAGEKEAALEEITSAVRLAPRDPELLLTLGRFYQKYGEQQKAVAVLQKASGLDPGSPAPPYSMAVSYIAADDQAAAMELLDRALKLDPHYDRALFLLGSIHLAALRLDEAEKPLAEALQLQPRNPFYHCFFGMLLVEQNRLDEAQSEFRQALAISPSYPLPHFHMGRLLERKGEYLQAESELEKAISLEPDLAEAYYRLGLLLNKRHEKEKADAAFARYKSLRDAEYSERATMLKELQDAVR